MTSYFANTFSASGIIHSIPPWDSSFQILLVRGAPQSSVTIFLDDLMNDLKVHDIPMSAFASCIYPDTPDTLIIPSLKRVILNGNNLTSLLQELSAQAGDGSPAVEELDLTRFCNPDLLEQYQPDLTKLEEKVRFYQQQSCQIMQHMNLEPRPVGPVTAEMLFLLQSLFPVTAENMGRPEKVLGTALTSSGWLSNVQGITTGLKRRYILHGSLTFLRTFFQLAESRAQNLNMKCHLLINPLFPEQVEGIIFPDEAQAVLWEQPHMHLVPGVNDVELHLDAVDPKEKDENHDFEKELKTAINTLIRAHSYREEMDEYYWYTADLEQLFLQRRRMMHQLLALCDGQELWEYFL